jgi:hypothetical protein
MPGFLLGALLAEPPSTAACLERHVAGSDANSEEVRIEICFDYRLAP